MLAVMVEDRRVRKGTDAVAQGDLSPVLATTAASEDLMAHLQGPCRRLPLAVAELSTVPGTAWLAAVAAMEAQLEQCQTHAVAVTARASVQHPVSRHWQEGKRKVQGLLALVEGLRRLAHQLTQSLRMMKGIR